MPTYGWVQETVDDRFHERGGEDARPRPAEFPCPVCAKRFPDSESLSWHVSTDHPIERPTLFTRGSPAPSVIQLRRGWSPADIVALNCTQLLLSRNGRPEVNVDPHALGHFILEDTDADYRLRLLNERAADEAKIEARYTLRVAIPDADELTAVDQLFVRRLAIDHPSMADVERFAKECKTMTSARYYTDALVSYSIGVLIKERTEQAGAALPFAAYPGKLAAALTELSLFEERPIARAVTTCARLNLNEFLANPRSGITVVDACHAYFARLQAGGEIRPAGAVTLDHEILPLCPVDRDTHDVLGAFAALTSPDAGERIQQLEERATDGTLSSLDQVKIGALAASGLILADATGRAAVLLRALANDPHLGSWAQTQLTATETR